MNRRHFTKTLAASAIALHFSHPLLAATENKAANIKQRFPDGLKPLFNHQADLIRKRRANWLAKAAKATPKLIHTPRKPVGLVKPEKTDAGFQGWKLVPAGTVDSILNKPLVPGDSFILDFGEHFTGYFTFSLRQFDIPVDAPVRLGFVFGEVPADVSEPFEPYKGGLTRAWLQDEVMNFDDIPSAVRLPRRYAYRYVKITVISSSQHGKFGFSSFETESVSSANEKNVSPLPAAQAADAPLDLAARRTLRDCMQTVFEDGPKRDRRLWLGDLRLQALANYATFKNYDLVKRCLYILAGTADDRGMVSTDAFERPEPVRAGDSILDYTALFAPTLLEYYEASGDRQTAEDLWPLALKQLDFVLNYVNAEGLFQPAADWWTFIDWHPTLDKQAAEQGVLICSLRASQALAQKLGKTAEIAFIPEMISLMEKAAQTHLWDEAQGLFISGPARQISWASQAWLTLAGAATPEQSRRALPAVMRHDKAEKPVTPYMHHYMVAALFAAGLRETALEHMRAYWGGMVQKGADTFWEVYVPGNDTLSPYGSHLMNSYCHAWSCTPTYFIRTQDGKTIKS
jgi:hypothetical protein